MNKQKRAEQAKQWTEKMDIEYASEISRCIQNTEVLNGPLNWNKKDGNSPKTVLTDLDSVSAIFEYAQKDQKCAVLDFASFKNPGGGFLNGSIAQEEALCSESFLYNVLREFDDYYEFNRSHLNNGMYMDRMLYTPDVRFFHNEEDMTCDVITCAAPNYSVGLKYGTVSRQENSETLKRRIAFVLDAAEQKGVKTLILGAFGCGVFKQDPKEVASLFKEELQGRVFDQVVFAVIDRDSINYRAFENVLFDI